MEPNVLHFFETLHQEYGDIVHTRIGRRHWYLLTKPAHVQHVLQDNYRNYDRNTIAFQLLRLVFGNSLLTTDGPFWLKQRRLAQPAFHRKRLAQLADTMTDLTCDMMERWQTIARQDGRLDAAHELMRLTLNIVGQTMFSTGLKGKADIFDQSIDTLNAFFVQRLRHPLKLSNFLPTPLNIHAVRAIFALHRLVDQIIVQRQQQPTMENDLLAMLMEATDAETGETMSRRQLRNEALTIISAGHETTSNALTWTLWLLGKHPDILARLRSEVDASLAGRVPTIDDLPRLAYTKMVLEESMRLYPPAYIFSRRAQADDQIDGFQIRKGGYVALGTWMIHHRADLWPDPQRFDPDRFTPEQQKTRHRFAYMPFGGGPHLCIGNNFAMMEATLILAMIVQQFDFTVADNHPGEVDPAVTLGIKNGLPLCITTR
jgi:cytochrome P450